MKWRERIVILIARVEGVDVGWWIFAAVLCLLLLGFLTMGCTDPVSGLPGTGAPVSEPIPLSPDPSPEPPAEGPIFLVAETTHGDEIMVPALLTIHGRSGYLPVHVTHPSTLPLAILVGQRASWCGPVASVAGILTEESAGKLGLSDAFTGWWADACSLHLEVLDPGESRTVYALIDAGEVGETVVSVQYLYVGAPPCVEPEENFCGEFPVTVKVER